VKFVGGDDDDEKDDKCDRIIHEPVTPKTKMLSDVNLKVFACLMMVKLEIYARSDFKAFTCDFSGENLRGARFNKVNYNHRSS
jgi:hypothetical protein